MLDPTHPDEEPRGTVCVLGLGYIGLPTAGLLAANGYQVHGVEVRPDVVDTINRGEIHIHEPHLDELIRNVVDRGRLSAHSTPCAADVFVICVPTPIRPDRSPDLSYVEAAAKAIRPYVRRGALIILESTCPPGTTRDVVVPCAIPAGLEVSQDVHVAYCPERVLPGRILREVVENDRTVGGITPACAQRAKAFLESCIDGEVHTSDAVTAEMSKLVENAYRDVNIAFANELSMLAQQFGIDPHEVIELANHHPRVHILTPGPGVGGRRLGVDSWSLVHAAPRHTPLIQAARAVNDHKPHFIVDGLVRLIKQHRIEVVGCLGLAYKADVDDLRESPSREIVEELKRRKVAQLLVCEPYIDADRAGSIPLRSLDDVLRHSQMLVLLTDHRQFRELPFDQLADKVLVDTRGAWRNRSSTAPSPSRKVA